MLQNAPFPSARKIKNFIRRGTTLSYSSTLGRGTPSPGSTPRGLRPLERSPIFKNVDTPVNILTSSTQIVYNAQYDVTRFRLLNYAPLVWSQVLRHKFYAPRVCHENYARVSSYESRNSVPKAGVDFFKFPIL